VSRPLIVVAQAEGQGFQTTNPQVIPAFFAASIKDPGSSIGPALYRSNVIVYTVNMSRMAATLTNKPYPEPGGMASLPPAAQSMPSNVPATPNTIMQKGVTPGSAADAAPGVAAAGDAHRVVAFASERGGFLAFIGELAGTASTRRP